MQNQSGTLGGGTLHSVHVQKEVVTDTMPDQRSVDSKYAVDEVYGHKI